MIHPPLAIVGATVIDGTGRSPVSDATVVIVGERIRAVGTDVPVPDSAIEIDARGKFLLPGLIDCHVHIYSSDFSLEPPAGDETAYGGVIGYNNLRSALQRGVTTVRDLSSGGIGLALRTAVERGQLLGPRCFVCGHGLCMTGGHSSGDLRLGIGVREVDGPENLRAAVRRERKSGADLIKLLTSHRSEMPEFSQEELDAAVDEAHRLGLRVAAHAANYVTTRMAALAGVDTIEHGIEIDRTTAELMAERGTILVSTSWVLYDIFDATRKLKTKLEEIGEYAHHPGRAAMDETLRVYAVLLERLPEAMRHVREAGVRIAAGTDNVRSRSPFAVLAKEAPYLVRFGLTPMEAIESLTRVGAEAIGVTDDLGTVEVGKYADLILLERDPLEDVLALEEIAMVMKGGVVIPRHPEWEPRPVGQGLALDALTRAGMRS